MPWKTKNRQEQRYELIRLMMKREQSVRELSRRFKISCKTAYKWRARFRVGRLRALVDRSRRPRRVARRNVGSMVEAVRAFAAAETDVGSPEVAACTG